MDNLRNQGWLEREPMIDLFRAHPATVGETYWEHLCFAARTGAAMIGGGSACVAHGLLPFLFVTTGSRTIRRLALRLDRRQAAAVSSSPEELPIRGIHAPGR